MHGLNPEDEALVEEVLADVQASVSCRIGLAGSLAQRALAPDIARELAGKKLHDIDLLLLETEGGVETPELYRRFRVLERRRTSPRYYGLKHRRSGMWVDLFEPSYPGTTVPATFLDREFEATRIETQLLHLAEDLVYRSRTGTPIRKKWQDKLRALYAWEGLDRARLEAEFDGHASRFAEAYPEAPKTLDGYVALALALPPTPRWRDQLFLLMWYLRRGNRLGQ